MFFEHNLNNNHNRYVWNDNIEHKKYTRYTEGNAILRCKNVDEIMNCICIEDEQSSTSYTLYELKYNWKKTMKINVLS